MSPLDGGWLSLLNLPSVIKVQRVTLSFLKDGQLTNFYSWEVRVAIVTI
jgi:hypothetical protein